MLRGNNPIQCLKYIDYLQKEDQEEDYIENVLNFMSLFKIPDLLEIENINVIKKVLQHCLRVSGILFTNNQAENSLELLEAARNLVSQFNKKDSTLEKIKALIYNNIAAYCSTIDDNQMAVKFLENCLKKDSTTDTNLTGIFYNNLAGVYLTLGKYEKAFKYTKKSLYLLEPEIFPLVQGTPSKQLKEDPDFKKKLMILLIGYLNMGSVLEGYQRRTLDPEPTNEMLEMNPKDFFKNSYGLAKKFLGEAHSLTNRLYYCYTKSESLPFQEIVSPDDSDVERFKSPKKRLEDMLKSINNEDNAFMRKSINIRNRGNSSLNQSAKSISMPPVNNSFMKKSPSTNVIKSPKKNMDSDQSSPDISYEMPMEDRRPTRPMSGHKHKTYSPYLVPQSEGFYHSYRYHRPSSGASFRGDFHHQPSFTNTADQTQILLGLMLQQQNELNLKLNQKIDDLKPSHRNPYNTFGNVDSKLIDTTKEDSKLSQLQEEIENLKGKIKQLTDEKQTAPAHPQHANTLNLGPESAGLPSNTRAGFFSGNTPSSDNSAPIRRESLLSTKSSGKDFNRLAPQNNTNNQQTPVNKSDQIEQNNTTLPMLGGLSPIPKVQKFSEYPAIHQREPDWVPGKYSDPNNRKFPLDLSKVSAFQGTEEGVRERGKVEEKTDGNPANDNRNNSLKADNISEPNKSASKLIKQSAEKISINSTQPSTKDVMTAVGGSTIQTTTTIKQEETEKLSGQPNGKRIPSVSTAAATTKEQTDKDTSNMSIKIQGERDNTQRTQKGDQSEEEKPTRSDSDRSKSLTTGKRPSISIPTSIDYMDSPMGNTNNPMGQVKQPKYALVKKRIFIDDNVQYMIQCRAIWTKEERSFKLQLFGIDEKTGLELDKVESELELQYKDLRKILRYVEFKDIMPVTFHIKQIKNFYTLVRFLLMPFTTVRELENGAKEIAIYPKPPNLLTSSINDMPTIEFLGQQCVIIFTHVNRKTFRIILTDPDNVEEAVRIDVEFDQTSFDLCFQKIGGKDAKLRSVDTSNKIVAGFDDDADDEEVTDFRDIAKEMNNPDRTDEEELESFKVIHKDLAEDLGAILKDMETFLSSYGVQKLSQLADEKEIKYCKLKVNNKLKKNSLYFLWDRPDKQILEVRVQNFHETFAPDAKVKALGTYNYLYETVWKHFGLIYTQLDTSDKMGVCSLISEIFSLDVFDKEIPADDFDRYEENAIQFVPIEIGCYQRVFLGEKYKFPLTLSLVGIKGEPKGIRATIYNLEDASEVGAFFHINPSVWTVPEGERKKKSRRMATLTLTEHYYLEYLLKRCGWEIVKNWLVLDKRPNRIDIVGIKLFKEIRTTEQLENVLNPDTIFRHLGTRDEVEA